ncbi:MAG TPA: CDP-alcohol phosphatidyltransferase family protein [Mycobacteriales bacterium]|nr:CDP-alcohol phosphatidyltransferase family protein [Mycobacteriales bacterium]
MRPHLSLPNAVTSVSLLAGFAALLLVPTALAVAAGLVALAAVLDGVDGALARRAGGDRTFGAQLDSLTDLVCFCVVPAYALHTVAQADARAAAALVSGGFLLAGAWRLSRFPLVQIQGHFVGVPTPVAGVLLMCFALWEPAPALLLAVALSALMVSSVRFPTVLAAAAVVSRPVRGHLPGRRPGNRRPLDPRLVTPGPRGSRRPARRGRRAAARTGRMLRALGQGRRRR